MSERFGPGRHPEWCVRAPKCEAITGGRHHSAVTMVPRALGSTHGIRTRLWAWENAQEPIIEIEILDTGTRPIVADLSLQAVATLHATLGRYLAAVTAPPLPRREIAPR